MRILGIVEVPNFGGRAQRSISGFLTVGIDGASASGVIALYRAEVDRGLLDGSADHGHDGGRCVAGDGINVAGSRVRGSRIN